MCTLRISPTDLSYLPVRESPGLTEQHEFLEEKYLAQGLLARLPLPHQELVLSQQPSLFLDIHVTVPQRVLGQQIVAVPQLEANHILGLLQFLHIFCNVLQSLTLFQIGIVCVIEANMSPIAATHLD